MSQDWKREQEAGCQQPDGPVRCANNCGFFGSAATMNMCSKCYRDHVLQQTKDAANASAAATVKALSRVEPMDVDMDKGCKERAATDNEFMSGVHVLAGMAADDKATATASLLPPRSFSPPSAGLVSSGGSSISAAGPTPSPAAESVATPAAAPSQPNRCASCKRKVGLTGFKCRCNKVFCSSHRYSDAHNCSFDYKAAARDAIAKANPVVRGSKIEKI